MQIEGRKFVSVKLTRQITLVFVLFATALIAGVSLMTYRSAEQSVQTAATAELKSLALEKEAAFKELLENRLDTLRLMAGSGSIRNCLEQVETTGAGIVIQNAEVQRRLRSVVEETAIFEGLFLCQGGRVVMSSNPKVEGLTPSESLLNQAHERPFVEIPEASAKTNDLKIWLAVPVLNENGGVLGVIAGSMDTQPLQEIAQRGTQRSILIDCVMIDRNGSAITQSVHGRKTANRKGQSFSEIAKLALEGGSGELIGKNNFGMPAIIIYRWIPTRNFGLIMREDLEEAISPVYALGRRIIVISVVALLVAVALAEAVGRGITRPLKRLQLGAAQFRRGEFDTRLSEDDPGEIGELSREFNRMAASMAGMRQDLLKNAEELEKRVADRTGQLAMANFELAHEITERKRIEDELRSANEWADATNRDLAREIELRGLTTVELRAAKGAAEAANRAKSEFLANMSHEIRTPMNGILGMTELVLDTPLSPQQREYLNIVRGSGQALLDIINDVLDCAKIESGKLELECVHFSLRELIFELVKPIGFEAGQKGLELVADLPGSVPDSLMGDPIRLRQVLINLLGNAVKFTEEGEVIVAVDSTLNSDGKPLLRFAITDTGIGIAPEMQASVFAPFVQADGSTTRRFGGTGLGLAISSGLVEQMGGRLTVKSELGKGSCFEFSVAFERGLTVDTAQQAKPGELQGRSVLIVDDNAVSRRVIEGTVHGWGMRAVSVGREFDAICELRKSMECGDPFDFVLLDTAMPDSDGLTLAEQMILHRSETAHRIVLMSPTVVQPDTAGRIHELGIENVLNKPFAQMELQRALLAALGVAIEGPASRNGAHPASRVLRILLAEDNPINQHVASSFLASRGHQVQVVADGVQAVEAAQQAEFDVILMDVQMPKMDGFEATIRIRAHQSQSGRRVPIVALTARAMKGDEEKCLLGGMDAYISKPFARAALINAVEAVFNEQPSFTA